MLYVQQTIKKYRRFRERAAQRGKDKETDQTHTHTHNLSLLRQGSPLCWAISTGNKSAIKSVEDLRGGKFGVSRMGSGSQLMAYVLAIERGVSLIFAFLLSYPPLLVIVHVEVGVTLGRAKHPPATNLAVHLAAVLRPVFEPVIDACRLGHEWHFLCGQRGHHQALRGCG